MSLRSDIHTAFDVITPATGGMAERVVETARRQAPTHRRNRIVVRMRAPLSLVAALVAVAIIVAVFVGARMMQNSTPTPIPAAPDAQTVFNTEVAQLEARPLNLPHATSEASCPSTPNTSQTYDWGAGPVFGNGGPESTPSWGYYWDVTYFTDASVKGPVLIRGRDLISGSPLVFSGEYAYGPVASGPGLPEGWRSEVVLDGGSTSSNGSGRAFRVRQAMSKAFVGCFGVQIDGTSFSEAITGLAAP